MRNDRVCDNARLLLYAVVDAIEKGASPQALAFYRDAADALADGRVDDFLTAFASGERNAL